MAEDWMQIKSGDFSSLWGGGQAKKLAAKVVAQAEKAIMKGNQAFLKKLANALKKVKKAAGPFKEMVKGINQSKTVKGIEGFAKGFEAIGQFAMNSIGVFIQLAEKMGIIKPILDILGAVFAIIGGSAMQQLGQALSQLAEVLFSPAMMEVWEQLGFTIGLFLKEIMNAISTLLADPQFKKVLMAFVKAIAGVLTALGAAIGGFLKMLGGMSAKAMGALFYGMAIFFAFMKGMAHGGPTGAILGALYAGIVAIALAPLLNLGAMAEGGIVTRPTIALIGEAGPEAVIPLSGDTPTSPTLDNQELVWATEDNGRKLDMLLRAQMENNRIKRMKML